MLPLELELLLDELLLELLELLELLLDELEDVEELEDFASAST